MTFHSVSGMHIHEVELSEIATTAWKLARRPLMAFANQDRWLLLRASAAAPPPPPSQPHGRGRRSRRRGAAAGHDTHPSAHRNAEHGDRDSSEQLQESAARPSAEELTSHYLALPRSTRSSTGGRGDTLARIEAVSVTSSDCALIIATARSSHPRCRRDGRLP